MDDNTVTDGRQSTYRVDADQFERWLKKYLKDLNEGRDFKPSELGLVSYQYVSPYRLTAVELPDSPKPILLREFLDLNLITNRRYRLTFWYGYSSVVSTNLADGVLFRLDLAPSSGGLDVTLRKEHERLEGFYQQFQKNISWEFPESQLYADRPEQPLPAVAVTLGGVEPDVSATGQKASKWYNPPHKIGEYIFNGTPEQLAIVVAQCNGASDIQSTNLFEPWRLFLREEYHLETTEHSPFGKRKIGKRDKNHVEMVFRNFTDSPPNMRCTIDATARPGNQATVIVKLHFGELERIQPAWEALREAITKHGYTFTPLGESQETTTATTPEAQEKGGRKKLLCNLWAFAETLLGRKPEDILEGWKELYKMQTNDDPNVLADPLGSMKQGIRDRGKEYRGMSKK